MTFSVAVVESDRQLNNVLTEYLRGRGYDCSAYYSLKEARDNIKSDVELVVFETILPDGDGTVLLQELHQKFPEQKYLIVTSDESLSRRLHCFAHGVDDYMKKPLCLTEFAARIQRLLCPKCNTSKNPCLDMRHFSPGEQRILCVLLRSYGQPVGLHALTKAVHDSAAAVYTCISRLRQKVKKQYKIKVAYGRGWYLEVL